MKDLLKHFILLIAIARIIRIQGQGVNPLQTTPEGPFLHQLCPAIDDPTHPIQLSHPQDCQKYYSCLNGYAHPLTCPNGLHWSTVTYRCDLPTIAKCSLEQQQETPTIKPEENPQYPPFAYSNFHYQAYPFDCNKYVQCQVISCPSQFHWNVRLQRCEDPQLAGCTISNQFTVPIAATPPPSNLPPPMPISTPSTFSPPSPLPSTINWPYLNPYAYIGNQTMSGNLSLHPSKDLDNLCNTTGAKFLPYPGDCHRFIQCNGIAFVKTCPANLLWNSQLMTCDHFCK